MARLAATLIDVGWGDSILLETDDAHGNPLFALIDCNDDVYQRSAYLFVKRYFELQRIDFEANQPNFRFVLLTHGHADHAQGLKRVLQEFGSAHFWYPKSIENGLVPALLHYARTSPQVGKHEAVYHGVALLDPATGQSLFGDVTLDVLWPPHDQVDTSNENLNSVVLAATLANVCFLFTGDAEAQLWPTINPRIPANTRVFQLPHHGARNGLFDGPATPWLDQLNPAQIQLVMSSHIRPHGHPHPDVITELDNRAYHYLRTDQHYHLTVETDGNAANPVKLKYSSFR